MSAPRCTLKLNTTVLGCVFLAACTQEPAQVVLKNPDSGTSRYAASPASYNSLTPASGNAYSDVQGFDSRIAAAPTEHSVGVQSIGVSDLPPPLIQKKTEKSEPHASLTPPLPAKKPKQRVAFIMPTEGKVISRFGDQGKGVVNDGIVIAGLEGEPVYASAGGMVAYVGDDLKNYGNMVIIKHKDQKNTTYARLGRVSVKRAQKVQQGEVVGFIGGHNIPSLYFAVRNGKEALDPQSLLPGQRASL